MKVERLVEISNDLIKGQACQELMLPPCGGWLMLLNWVLEKTLKSPLTTKRSNLSILKEISPEHSLEGLMLKLQHFGHLMWRTDSLEKSLIRSDQLLSRVWLFVSPWITACQASLSITNSRSSLRLTSIESVMPSSHLILYHPLILLPSVFPSIRVFSNKLVLHIRWTKYWSLSISPSNKYSGLISFKIDRFDLLAVQGILKIFSNTTVQKHQFLGAQLSLWSSSHIHTTGKTVALTRCTFVSEVMFLLFNMLSRFVIAFLPRSKHLLISRLQSPSAVILEFKKIKSATVSIVSPSICHEVMGLDAMMFIFWMLSFKPAFSLSSFIFIKRLFSSYLLSAIRLENNCL